MQYFIKRTLFVSVAIIGMLQLASCDKNKSNEITKQDTVTKEQSKKTNGSEQSNSSGKSNKEQEEKGYNLPIDEKRKKQAEKECRAVGKIIEENLEGESSVDTGDVVLTEKNKRTILDKLLSMSIQLSDKESCLDNSYIVEGFEYQMVNNNKMEDFLKNASEGKKGQATIYEIDGDARVIRRAFSFNGKDMYVFSTNCSWASQKGKDTMNSAYDRISSWSYTEKGWFVFEPCVPEPPEVSEVVNATQMIRVKPEEQSYFELAKQYLLPIAYQGNNLFSSEWDEDHMEKIDYNGLFEFLYAMKNQKDLNAREYADGIPKDTFESIMIQYLPVNTVILEKKSAYNQKDKTYKYISLGCGNYAPDAVGTSIPEIVNRKENQDGTTTFTVDVVCEMLGKDKVFSHELTVRFLEDGGVQYIKNHILEDGKDSIPDYTYRVSN